MAIVWNEENLNVLKRKFEEGSSLDELSMLLGTTRRAVHVKLNRIGMGIHSSRCYTIRICAGCKKEESVTHSNAKEYKFCSKECWNNNRPIGPRKNGIKLHSNCVQCNKAIKKARRYCNNTCLSLHRNSVLLKNWLNGDSHLACGSNGTVRTFARNYMIDLARDKCTRCGWNEIHSITKKVPLTIDHIDGDSNNTHPQNLKVLCPNCHSLTPTYGALNKGKGRKVRKR